MRLLLCTFILATSSVLVSAGYMDTIYQWKYIDYLWPSPAARQAAIQNGDYIYSRILPMDTDKSRDGRVFLSMLGMSGVPAPLAVVTNQMGPSGPLLLPYPNWSWYRNKRSCDTILNVYRIKIDNCNRLWVLDTGYLEGEQTVCTAKLLAFDLNTDTLIARINIPDHIAGNEKGQSMLATPIVDTEGPFCENTTVFMADTLGNGLVIWNGVRLFRLQNPIFGYNENARKLFVGSESLDTDNGILGMDISPRIFPGESRFLYFHSLTSYDLFAADVQVLKRSNYGEAVNFWGARDIFSSHTVAHAFSSEGTLFFGLTREIAIGCWNRYRDLNRNNIQIVAQNNETLRYANGVKVIPPTRYGQDEELLILTNRFVRQQNGNLNANDYNFRVMSSPVQRLIAGTICEMPRETRWALQQIYQRNGDDNFVVD